MKMFMKKLTVPALIAMLATAIPTSCKKNEVLVPPVELEDQIMYNENEPVEIRSAIYETEENGMTTFYLSPTQGISDVNGMTAANDYLMISVSSADGEIDGTFELSYSSLHLTDKADAEQFMMSVRYSANEEKLDLETDIKMKDGTTLRAEYHNTCVEAVPETVPLNNEYSLDDERMAISSVLEWYDHKEAAMTYCFYAENLTEPDDNAKGLVIRVKDGQSTENIDLSTVTTDVISIECGAFTNNESTAGTLTLSKDKFGEKITLSLNAESGDSHLQAEYTGTFINGYYSGNYFSVTTKEGDVEKNDIQGMFLYNNGTQNILAIGQTQNATTPEDFMEGHFAVELLIGNTAEGMSLVLPEDAGECGFFLYDYETYSTLDINGTSGKGATGKINVKNAGDKTYVGFAVTFPDGTIAEGEWFGEMTIVEEEFDLTPIVPFSPTITITSEDGTVLYHKTITSMEVRLEKDYRLRGGDPQYGGATFDAYFFYFRPEGYEESIDDPITVPSFMYMAENIPTKGEIDLAQAGADTHWNFKFQNSNFKYTEYFENYEMYGMKTLRCPDNVKVNIMQDENKIWNFYFEMTDYGSFSSYTPDLKEGTKNRITIEWRDSATKYSGSKVNDMDTSEY